MSEITHASDCAVNSGPAYPAGPCDCGATDILERIEAILAGQMIRNPLKELLAECAITIKAYRSTPATPPNFENILCGAEVRAVPQFEVPSGLPDLLTRAQQFQCRELPGQPLSMHMGTLYLVNDMVRAIARIPAMVEEIGKLNRLMAQQAQEVVTEIEAATQHVARLQTAWHDAECGRDRLRAALLKYGHHLGHCDLAMNDGNECTCGFKEASGQ